MSRMSLLAESSSRSAWNARAAVLRCSGARVLRTPNHVKLSFTAAIVARSLLAAERSSWVVGVLVGEVVVRLVVCWPVVGSVVVAVDIGTCDLLEGWMEGPAAKTDGGSGWEKPLASDCFGALGSPISHRGDHGAACQKKPESRGKNPGSPLTDRAAGFCRAERRGREGYPVGR